MNLRSFSLSIEVEQLTADYFNPFYYMPEFTALDERLKRRGDSKSLGELIGKTGPSRGPTIYQGKSPTGGPASKGNIVLVMPRMLTGRGLDRGDDFVPPPIEKGFESRRLYGGEVLLLRSAHKAEYIGAAVDLFIPNGYQAVPSDTVIAIRCEPLVLDPSYFVSFLRSHRFGYPQIQRHITSQNAKLTPEALTDIRVIVPRPELQWAIGNKVRVAEKIRNESELSRTIIHEWLNVALPQWELPTDQMSVNPVFTSNVSSERLDAWFNHPRFQQLEQALNECSNLVHLETVATVVGDRWGRTPGEIEYIEIGEFDLSQGTVRGTLIEGKRAPSRAQILANRGDVAISLVRPNRQNIAFIQGTSTRLIVVTSGCTVLRFDNQETAALYSVILRHNAITYQIMRWNTGTNYPAIEQLRLERILVPAIPESERQRLLTAAKMAVTGQERAKTLTEAAIKDVEDLIDGTLDEATCLEEGRELADEFGLERP